MIKDTSPRRPPIRDTSPRRPPIDPEIVRKALGAEEIHRELYLSGSPLILQALRREIVQRLKSKGGRPSLEGTDQRVKIPVAEEDWKRFGEIAKSLSAPGHVVSTGQVASALLHNAMEHYDAFSKRLMTSAPPPLIGGVSDLEKFRDNAHELLQKMEVLDVDGMVEWSKRFPSLERLWIIAPEFRDNEIPSVLQEVVYNIQKRDVHFTYFVRAVDTNARGRFTTLKKRIAAQVGDTKAQSHVHAVRLSDDDLLWLQTDYVIANHHRLKETVGFQFIRDANKPTLAIRMQDGQLVGMIKSLEPFVEEKMRSPGRVVPMKKRD